MLLLPLMENQLICPLIFHEIITFMHHIRQLVILLLIFHHTSSGIFPNILQTLLNVNYSITATKNETNGIFHVYHYFRPPPSIFRTLCWRAPPPLLKFPDYTSGLKRFRTSVSPSLSRFRIYRNSFDKKKIKQLEYLA